MGNNKDKTLDEIYNLMVILNDYCDKHSDIEEVTHIYSLVKILLNKVDELNAKGYY